MRILAGPLTLPPSFAGSPFTFMVVTIVPMPPNLCGPTAVIINVDNFCGSFFNAAFVFVRFIATLPFRKAMNVSSSSTIPSSHLLLSLNPAAVKSCIVYAVSSVTLKLLNSLV